MNLLVTAGNTFVPIDGVRGITNVFTGRTGARTALEAPGASGDGDRERQGRRRRWRWSMKRSPRN